MLDPLTCVIILGLCGTLGIALLLLGWRGRRVDDHPLCRLCGYDLVGSEAAVNCPECGRDLRLPRARRIGHRRRRWAVLSLGGLVLLGSLGGGGALGWAAAKGFDFNPYKPLWVLRREASGANPPRARAAQQEIFTRLNGGKLSKSQIDSVVSEGLRVQADPSAKWDAWLGDFIETAWQHKDISDQTVVQYVKNAVQGAFSLRIPGRVHKNAMTVVTLDQHSMRAGRGWTFMVELEQQPLRDETGTTLVHGEIVMRSSVSAGSSGSNSVGFQARLPMGRHHVSAEATVRVGAIARVVVNRDSPATWTMATWPLKLEAEFEVVAPEMEIVGRVRDSSLTSAMGQAVSVIRCRAMDLRGIGTMLTCQIEFKDAPMPGAFEVFARVGEREWPAGIATTAEDDGARSLGRFGDGMNAVGRVPLTDFPADADRVDIVLRASARVAEEAGLSRMWDGEIVIKDVLLDRPFPHGGAPSSPGRPPR